MSTATAEQPNAEMIRYWNEAAGPAWVAMQERLDVQVGPLGARALARAEPRAGECVLDVGCGCGGTTLAIARAVGASGRVVAVDVSAPMLERARARATAAGLDDRIEWIEGDAQTAALGEARFDCVFSRFGVMFFEDPAAAFANLHRALRPEGRLAFVCWQAREHNPWLMVPMLAAARHIAFPPPPAADAPGPFALGDAARVRGILEGAGFAALELVAVNESMQLAATSGEDGVELFLKIGPLGAAMREANATPEQRERVVEAVGEALESFRTPTGLAAPAGAWIVIARRKA